MNYFLFVMVTCLYLGSRERKRPRNGPLDVEDRLESLITRVGEKVGTIV